MKRLMKGGFLTLSGTVGITGMILTAKRFPKRIWGKKCSAILKLMERITISAVFM